MDQDPALPQPITSTVPGEARERTNALFKVTFRLLHNITIDPWKIGVVTKAAFVTLHTEHHRTA